MTISHKISSRDIKFHNYGTRINFNYKTGTHHQVIIMFPVMKQNLGHRFKDNWKAETNHDMMTDNRQNGRL